MSDKEQPITDAKESENEQIQSKIKIEKNKIQSEKDKTKNKEIKAESNKKEEVAITINEETDVREKVRRKPITLAFYSSFAPREPPPPQPHPRRHFPPQPAPRFDEDGQYHPLHYKTDQRNDFIRLVLMLVLMMLIATAGFISMALINEPMNNFFRGLPSMILYILSLLLLMGVGYAFSCSPCASNPPMNFVMLFLTTVGMTIIATIVSVRYGTEVVLYATLATTGIVFCCVCLACTNFDFTRFMLYVVVISFAFSMIALIIILVKAVMGVWMKPVIIGIFAIATLLQAVLLVIEIQTILGGRAVELSEDDYAFGAYMLYTSIVQIFINMLHIIGLGSD